MTSGDSVAVCVTTNVERRDVSRRPGAAPAPGPRGGVSLVSGGVCRCVACRRQPLCTDHCRGAPVTRDYSDRSGTTLSQNIQK